MTLSTPGDAAGSEARPLHSVHYADANDTEITVNRQFLVNIEEFFCPETTVPLNIAPPVFADFFLET
jgi:hypothetical protein